MGNKIVGIVAIVVIILCVGFVVYRFTSGSSEKPKIAEGKYNLEEDYLKCLACGAEMTATEFDPTMGVGMVQEATKGGKGLKCPKCGKNKLFPGTVCLHCKTLFVPDYVKKGEEQPADVICPNCGKSALKAEK